MDYKREANTITTHINQIESELTAVLEMIERCKALVRDGNVPLAAILYGEIIAKLNECED